MNISERPELAVGVLGLGLIQVTSLFLNAAPNLQELRGAREGDSTKKQELLDATIIVGSITSFVAIVATYATKSALPAFIFLGGLGIVAAWHYLVLYSPQV